MTILNRPVPNRPALNRPTLGTVVSLDRSAPPVWVWSGDLDLADTPTLAATWRALIKDHPASVIIDLSGVTFLDCAVLSVLVRANNDPATQLLLQGVPARVETILQVTSLDGAFTRAHPLDSLGPTRAT
jgi:anti-sigma B factor antagonist